MERKKITIKTLRQLYSERKQIACITAYDSQTAKLVDNAGVHLILVGDSLGMTVLGFETTVPVTLDMMLHHTAAVCRGNKTAFVVGDMPFASYHISQEKAIESAALYLQKANADAVKLEGGENMAPTIRKLVDAGIPVMAHIGLLPQTVLREGGYRKYGKNEKEILQLKRDAIAVQEAGAFSVVLEGVEENVAKEITEMLQIPTIGIAAGKFCSGQIQVVNDLLGLISLYLPKHAKKYADLNSIIEGSITKYVEDVISETFFEK